MSNKSKEYLSEKLLKKRLYVNSLIYIELSVLELNIKQFMPQALQSTLGPDWINIELKKPTIPLFKEEISIIQGRKSQNYTLTEKKFMEEVSFGFWVELLNRETYRLLKGAPI